VLFSGLIWGNVYESIGRKVFAHDFSVASSQGVAASSPVCIF
jgi:hypothetical protein